MGLAEDLLACGPAVEYVTIPELGRRIGVRPLGLREQLELNDRKAGDRETTILCLVRSLVDEDGERLFQDSDAKKVGDMPAGVLSPLIDAVGRLSGMGVEDTAGN